MPSVHTIPMDGRSGADLLHVLIFEGDVEIVLVVENHYLPESFFRIVFSFWSFPSPYQHLMKLHWLDQFSSLFSALSVKLQELIVVGILVTAVGAHRKLNAFC
jgi:hypothetical protein